MTDGAGTAKEGNSVLWLQVRESDIQWQRVWHTSDGFNSALIRRNGVRKYEIWLSLMLLTCMYNHAYLLGSLTVWEYLARSGVYQSNYPNYPYGTASSYLLYRHNKFRIISSRLEIKKMIKTDMFILFEIYGSQAFRALTARHDGYTRNEKKKKKANQVQNFMHH